MFLLAALQLAPPPKLPPLKAKPNVVMGRCVTMAGKPLAGVKIFISGTTLRGERTSYETTSNAAGVYAQVVAPGIYHVGRANWETAAPAGPSYWLPLRPFDGNDDDAPSAKGIVEDFVLRVSGKTRSDADPDSWVSYYGGTIRISEGHIPYKFPSPDRWRWPEGAKVAVNLTPLTPLADGTPAKPLARTVERQGASAYVYDVPIAKYRVTAELVLPDGARRPLKVRAARYFTGRAPSERGEPGETEFLPSDEIYFPANGTDSTPILRGTGVYRTTLYIVE